MCGKIQRFPIQYIKSVNSPNGCGLGSNCEIHNVFWAHFCDHFAHFPDLPVQEFRSYLADLPHIPEAEAASC